MTNKINGFSADFALAKKEGTRIIVGYEKTEIDGTALAMWFEVYFHQSVPTLQQVKDAIFADINSQTDAEILCGFNYTIQHGSDQGKQVKVWLSEANQTDIDRLANASGVAFPVRHKVAEDGAGNAIYEEFQNATEMKSLSDSFIIYIHQCQESGWQRKDAFDWQAYQQALDALTPTT